MMQLVPASFGESALVYRRTRALDCIRAENVHTPSDIRSTTAKKDFMVQSPHIPELNRKTTPRANADCFQRGIYLESSGLTSVSIFN
jgi:hypothetical protein